MCVHTCIALYLSIYLPIESEYENVRMYFEELAHETVGTHKSALWRAGRPTGHGGKR